MEQAELRFTHHAQLRMQQRKISRAEVEDVVSNYHTSYTDRGGNPILIGHPGGRRIKVVVKKGSSPLLVITVGD